MLNKVKTDLVQIPAIGFILLFFIMPVLECRAQDTRFDEAAALFNSGGYKNALPVFKTLVGENPESETLNYYLGACMVEEGIITDETISTLLKAISGNTPDNIFYYTGRYYQAVEDWNSALKYYNRFKNYASPEEKETLRIDALIAQCYEKSGSPAPADTLKTPVITTDTTISELTILPEEITVPDSTGNPTTAGQPGINPVDSTPPPKPESVPVPISFQVNEVISYIFTENFKTEKGKESFENGRNSEIKLEKILAEADSLRKAYNNSSKENKKSISERIISLEMESLTLKNQSDDLFYIARDAENEYWSNAGDTEIAAFISEIEKTKRLINKRQTQPEETKAEPLPLVEESTTGESLAEPLKKEEIPTADEVVYKVQIGSYGKTVPAYIDKLYKKLSLIRKIDKYTDDRGITVYTTGQVTRFGDAIRLQNQVRQEGVKDAFVVAYKNGKRIPINEAKSLTEKP